MSTNDEFIAQLEDYFEAFDGTTPLPDRVRDAIRAELPSARQVQPGPGLLRIVTMFPNVSNGARLGLAAAAVVVAAVLGTALLNNRGTGPGVVTPTPSPASTPSAISAPSPSLGSTPLPSSSATALGEPLRLNQAPLAPCDSSDTSPSTCVAPATYQLNDWPGPNTWPVRVTLDVPAGWFDWDAGAGLDAVLVDGGPEARGASGWGALFATVGDVSRDPCDASKGVTPAAQFNSPQKLAAAMAAWPKFKATTPRAVTVDGHSGLKLELTSTAPSACSTKAFLWRTTSGVGLDAYPMVGASSGNAPATFEIIDTGHGLLVMRTTDFPQTSPNELAGGVPANPTRHATDQVELHAILASIRLTAFPG